MISETPQAVTGSGLETGPAERALTSALRTMFGLLRIVMVIVIVALLFSNTRFLQQNQRAVILRFGRIVGPDAGRVYGPGLVFAWPQPIDEIIVVDAGRIQVLELDDFMFRKEARGDHPESLGPTLSPSRDGYTLTSDANIIHTMWRVEYRIEDVIKYALNVEDPETLLRRALAAAVVHTSAEFDVEQALWYSGPEMRLLVIERTQHRLDEADSGIKIEQVRTPIRREPKQAEHAFRESQQAGQEAAKMIEEADRLWLEQMAVVGGDAGPELVAAIRRLAEAEEKPAGERDEAEIKRLRADVARLLNIAGGRVAEILNQAKTYRTTVAADAASLAKAFDALEREYRKNATVFVQEVYKYQIERILSQVGSSFLVYPRDREWRIQVEPKRKKTTEEKQTELSRTPEEYERLRRR